MVRILRLEIFEDMNDPLTQFTCFESNIHKALPTTYTARICISDSVMGDGPQLDIFISSTRVPKNKFKRNPKFPFVKY